VTGASSKRHRPRYRSSRSSSHPPVENRDGRSAPRKKEAATPGRLLPPLLDLDRVLHSLFSRFLKKLVERSFLLFHLAFRALFAAADDRCRGAIQVALHFPDEFRVTGYSEPSVCKSVLGRSHRFPSLHGIGKLNHQDRVIQEPGTSLFVQKFSKELT